MSRPSAALAPLVACALGLVACRAVEARRTTNGVQDVRRMVVDGRFEEALVRADALAEARPGDESVAMARRDAYTALLLERARRLSFDDQDERALEQVEAALSADPDSVAAAAWRERLMEKLAERWFQRGRDAHAQGAFDAAEAGYQKALDYVPAHHLALSQLRELELNLGYRRAQSTSYYNDGVRAFAGGRLSEARSGFESSRKYEDDDVTRTERRIGEVQREAALASKHRAEVQASSGYWLSAKRCLDEALAFDPELSEGEELSALYSREADVADRLREAEIARLRGQHERARELLALAAEQTTAQREAVASALLLIDDAEVDGLYQAALDLEYDFRYEEAVVKYRELLAQRDYFKDARARLGTLESAIKDAAELYASASAAATSEEKIELYRQVELVWPEYRDVRARLDALAPKR